MSLDVSKQNFMQSFPNLHYCHMLSIPTNLLHPQFEREEAGDNVFPPAISINQHSKLTTTRPLHISPRLFKFNQRGKRFLKKLLLKKVIHRL